MFNARNEFGRTGLRSRYLLAVAAVGCILICKQATAQTTFGSGTQLVIPTAANISVYHTKVFIRNPNPNAITLGILYYQSINGTPPAGLRSCTPVVLNGNQSYSFDLGVQCGLTGSNDDFGMIVVDSADGVHPC